MQYDSSFCALFQTVLFKMYKNGRTTCNTTYKLAKTD